MNKGKRMLLIMSESIDMKVVVGCREGVDVDVDVDVDTKIEVQKCSLALKPNPNLHDR